MENLKPYIRQIGCYVVVGLISNFIAYLGYLCLIWFGWHYLSAMVFVFLTAISISFVANRKWTFNTNRKTEKSNIVIGRYLACNAAALAFNAVVLTVLVESTDVTREIAQLILMPIVAVILFLLQRFWVFKSLE